MVDHLQTAGAPGTKERLSNALCCNWTWWVRSRISWVKNRDSSISNFSTRKSVSLLTSTKRKLEKLCCLRRHSSQLTLNSGKNWLNSNELHPQIKSLMARVWWIRDSTRQKVLLICWERSEKRWSRAVRVQRPFSCGKKWPISKKSCKKASLKRNCHKVRSKRLA